MTTNTVRTNKRDQLTARIIRHGEALLLAFPEATERDPMKLCKLMRRWEIVAHRAAEKWCNGEIEEGAFDAESERAERHVCRILGVKHTAGVIWVNSDPRGYSLKVSEDFTKGFNRNAERALHTDWGGYGILAPDLTEG